jgi:hypothetical protein
MKRLALAFALIGTLLLSGWVWLRVSDEETARFEACRWDGDTLVLQWTAGVNQRVSASLDSREGGALTAALNRQVEGGTNVAIALPGEARFQIYGGETQVRYEDGTSLDCA